MEKEKSLLTHEEAVKKAKKIVADLAELDKEAMYHIGSSSDTEIIIQRDVSAGILSEHSIVAIIYCLPPIVAPPAGTPVVVFGEGASYGAIRISSGEINGDS